MICLKNFLKSKTTRDVQWTLFSFALAAGVHFFLRLLLGRELGVSGLGIYTLVFTIYMFGTQFAGFGMGPTMTQYVAEFQRDDKKVESAISTGLTSSLFFGTLMGLTLFLFSNFISISIFKIPEMSLLLKITALSFPFLAIQKCVLGVLNGLREMKKFAFITIFQNLFILIISALFVVTFSWNLTGAVLGFVLPTIFVTLFSQIYIKNFLKYENIYETLNNPMLKELISFGIIVTLTNSLYLVNTQVDSLLIGYFLSDYEVGLYAVAVTFIQGITLIPSAIQRVTTPAVANYYGNREQEKIKKLIKISIKRTLIISSLLGLFLAIFGQELIELLFSAEFSEAYIPLLILICGNVIYASVISVGSALTSVGLVNLSFKINALCAILNVILNIIFIPFLGIIGAALATSIALIMTSFIYLLFFYKYIFKTPLLILQNVVVRI